VKYTIVVAARNVDPAEANAIAAALSAQCGLHGSRFMRSQVSRSGSALFRLKASLPADAEPEVRARVFKCLELEAVGAVFEYIAYNHNDKTLVAIQGGNSVST
jgi:hypothetical protein